MLAIKWMREGADIPKVDETKDHTGYHGKVGEVETHARSRGDREGDVVPRADSAIEGDGACDDDVADSADVSEVVRGRVACLTTVSKRAVNEFETHIAADASLQLSPRAMMDAACCIVPTLAPSDNQRKR